MYSLTVGGKKKESEKKRRKSFGKFEMRDSRMAFSDLPRELVTEVLSRVPLTSLGRIRSTRKYWNDLISNDTSFTSAVREKKEFLAIMMMDFRAYLLSVDLRGIREEDDDDKVQSSIKRKGKLISTIEDANPVGISAIYHCDGLLLCINKEIDSRLVVWNPYLGQRRWIKPRIAYSELDRYALGYEKKSIHSHKILRFVDHYIHWTPVRHIICEFEIYNLESNSWNVVDVDPDWEILCYHHGVSVEGNAYWFAREKIPIVVGELEEEVEEVPDFLICFDFTTEMFGPRLPLPFHFYQEDLVAISSVGDEQLAVLFQHRDLLTMEIWVTTKIEPKHVSWNKFLAVDMKPLTGFTRFCTGSFFINQKEKVAVVFDKQSFVRITRNIAYLIGENGYVKVVDLGETSDRYCYPRVCSYVPSSVQIKQVSRGIEVAKTVEETTGA